MLVRCHGQYKVKISCLWVQYINPWTYPQRYIPPGHSPAQTFPRWESFWKLELTNFLTLTDPWSWEFFWQEALLSQRGRAMLCAGPSVVSFNSTIPCRTTCVTRLLAGTVSDNLWRRFCSQRTDAFSALEVSRRCAIQIDFLLTYLLTYYDHGLTHLLHSHLRCHWINDVELVPKQFAWAGHANWLFSPYNEDLSFWSVLGTLNASEAFFATMRYINWHLHLTSVLSLKQS